MSTENDFPVRPSAEALDRLRRILARAENEGKVLRVGVKGGGCSGLEYVTRLEDAPRANDLVAEFEGMRLVCDPKSARFLQGATLTFSAALLGGGFKFDNPNAARGCGCGTSFTPKA
ncbi:MAG: iron-sulfur cluster assembly accessory protein [Fimbriimonadaceae bacterium]|nr:iron-sulfur cluster assembly accessory protein [Fimbriimonadaceae bacterium]